MTVDEQREAIRKQILEMPNEKRFKASDIIPDGDARQKLAWDELRRLNSQTENDGRPINGRVLWSYKKGMEFEWDVDE